jgi:hypothetical protein
LDDAGLEVCGADQLPGNDQVYQDRPFNDHELARQPLPYPVESNPLQHDNEKRTLTTICGLKKTFWLIVLFTFLVIGVGVGGGIAARFAGAKSESSNLPETTQNIAHSSSVSQITGTPQTDFQVTQLQTLTLTNDGTTVVEILTTITSARAITTQDTTHLALTVTTMPRSDPCADTLHFTTSVTWAGVSNTIYPPQVYWVYDLPSGSSCCSHCWSLTPQKCNV